MPKHSRNSPRSNRPRIHPIRRPLPVVNSNEWDFSSLPNNESVYCFLYSWTRLACLDIAPQLDSKVKGLRQKADDPKSFDSLQRVALDLVGPGAGTWRLIVAFPEWPAQPYLSIPLEERARRLRILFPDDYPTHTTSNAKDILTARIPKDFVARIEAAMKAYGLPVIPLGSGCRSVAEVELMKLKGQEIDWSHLELQPGEIPEIFLGVVMFHWLREDPVLIQSYADLLKLIRPEQIIPKYKLPKAKETQESKSRYDLKELGAYWLLRRMHWKQAALLTYRHSGTPLYGTTSKSSSGVEFHGQSEWLKARRNTGRLLKSFGELNPL